MSKGFEWTLLQNKVAHKYMKNCFHMTNHQKNENFNKILPPPLRWPLQQKNKKQKTKKKTNVGDRRSFVQLMGM